MKTLQNNFTTHEQSKRLLELGVPADSADCCYLAIVTRYDVNEAVIDYAKWVTVLEDGEQIGVHDLPCWSAGRLLDIYLLSVEMETNIKPNAIFFLGDNKSLMENLMEWFETESFDFSKLDEYGNPNPL